MAQTEDTLKIVEAGNQIEFYIGLQPIPEPALKNKVFVKPLNLTPGQEKYLISGPFQPREYLLTNLLDENDAQFSAGDWRTFYTTKTGNFNTAGGGSLANDFLGWGSYKSDLVTELAPISLIGGDPYIELANDASSILSTEKPIDIDSFYYQLKLNVSDFVGDFEIGELVQVGGRTGELVQVGNDFLSLCGMESVSFPPTTFEITGVDSGATCTYQSVHSRYSITGRFGDGINLTISFAVKPLTNQPTRVTVVPDIGGTVGEISDYERDIVFSKGLNVTQRYLSSFDAYTYDTWQNNGGVLKIKSDENCEVFDIRYLITRTHKARNPQ